jgi:hypothetical protein
MGLAGGRVFEGAWGWPAPSAAASTGTLTHSALDDHHICAVVAVHAYVLAPIAVEGHGVADGRLLERGGVGQGQRVINLRGVGGGRR